MDSIRDKANFPNIEIISILNQNTTDLEKAIDYCIFHKINNIRILGAIGARDDHSFANLMLLSKYTKIAQLQIITDNSTIECLRGKKTFESFAGQTISIISVKRVKSITTIGLMYELKNQSLKPSGSGVSNVAVGDEFTVQPSGKVWVFKTY